MQKLFFYNKGFTLVEIAVVMVILGLILGSILSPLSTQREEKRRVFTENKLQTIHDALMGYASINGFLPCPASATSNGLESRNGANNNCNLEHGWIPARTLGLNGSFDGQNRLLDEWTRPIAYSLTSVNNWEYAKQIQINGTLPTYRVCRQANCPTDNSVIAENLVSVVYALAADISNSTPQAENTDADNEFVNAVKSELSGSEFDDILVWISPNLLTLQLIKSGQL